MTSVEFMRPQRIGFVIPGLGLSGGINIILNWARVLAKRGNPVDIISAHGGGTPYHFIPNDEMIGVEFITLNTALDRSYSLVLASWWETVYDLFKLKSERKAWFLQAYEAQFTSNKLMHDRYDEVVALKIPIIAIADWLKTLFVNYFGYKDSDISVIKNPLDKKIWCKQDRSEVGPVKFIVEGPSGDPRKNIHETIKLVNKLRVPYFWVGAGTEPSWVGPTCEGVFTNVTYSKMPEIYAKADVMIKASNAEGMFGPPLEMFATGGTSIAWAVEGAEEYMVDGFNCRLSPMNSLRKLKDIVGELSCDRGQVEMLKANALETASRWPTWDDMEDKIVSTIEKYTR